LIRGEVLLLWESAAGGAGPRGSEPPSRMLVWESKRVSQWQGFLVGLPGFEPGTSCTPSKRASQAAPQPENESESSVYPESPRFPNAYEIRPICFCMTYALGGFSAAAMARLSQRLRECSRQAVSLEGAARAVVDVFADEFEDAGRPAFPLVRLFIALPFAQLLPGDQAAALAAGGGSSLSPNAPCLTLLASRGDSPEWNLRTGTEEHRSVPMQSIELARRLPLAAAVLTGFGPEPSSRNFSVLRVPHALGSALIRDQEIVRQHGVSSAIGCGGTLPVDRLFAMVIFSRPPLDDWTDEFFQPLPTAVRLALLPRLNPVFEPPQ
jgi:hypothetical protein